jgi:hypothetical protein
MKKVEKSWNNSNCHELWIMNLKIENDKFETWENLQTDNSKCPNIWFLAVISCCNWFRSHPTNWSNVTLCLNQHINQSTHIKKMTRKLHKFICLIHSFIHSIFFETLSCDFSKEKVKICTFPSSLCSRIRDIPKS